ncbi:MAG: ABC transporter ATP-binding protein [Actinobacteria bacterium]|nr:ABC transporter ATP-binding protein [Actinomycetota bacterium]
MTEASDSAVHLVGVTKCFGEHTAVDDLTLEIKQGEFFSLLGPSGCGKTTTLRMIAGFTLPTTGRILLDGKSVERVPPYKRNVNTVFQSYALFEHLDVRGNIEFGLKRKRVPKSEIAVRVREALELVRLTGRERSKPAELSGGQRQRVALARALVNRPAVLLLDEPLGALDLQLRREMQVELKEIKREVAITFVYVTHDQEEALALSDRIAVMNHGVIEQCGTPEDVYEEPIKPFVAGFIGISNLIKGRIEAGGVKLSSGEFVEAEVPADGKVGEAVHLSVRPEKIWLNEVRSGMVGVKGTVVERVYLGTTTQVLVDLGAGSRVVALTRNAHLASSDSRWEIGQRVDVAWEKSHALILR